MPDLSSTRHQFTELQQQAAARGVALRAPPPEPTTCCGRGCNGCVWEGWFAAARFWVEDALLALDSPAAGPLSPPPPGRPRAHAHKSGRTPVKTPPRC